MIWRFPMPHRKESAVSLAKEAEERYGVRCHYFQASLEQPGEGVKLFERCAESTGRRGSVGQQCRVTRFENLLDLTRKPLPAGGTGFQKLYPDDAGGRHMVEHRVPGQPDQYHFLPRGTRPIRVISFTAASKGGPQPGHQSIALDGSLRYPRQ